MSGHNGGADSAATGEEAKTLQCSTLWVRFQAPPSPYECVFDVCPAVALFHCVDSGTYRILLFNNVNTRLP